MKRLKTAFPVIIWAALLLPFFLAAPAAHPATDDFTFALYTHPTWVDTGSLPHVLKDALSYALRTWRDWQGTVVGVIIMTLNPIVFSLEHYGMHAVILLAAHLAGWYVFLAHMFGRRLGLCKKLWRGLYLALSACSLVFLPDIVEGIFWFNGAWFYTGAQAAALFALVLCDRFAETDLRGAKKALFALLCCGLLFALGLDNYITAMMTAAALFMMALIRLWAMAKTPGAGMIGVIAREGDALRTKDLRAAGGEAERLAQRRAMIRTAALLLPIGAGLLISVIAPGNSVRMETDGAHQSGFGWLLLSILWTMRDAVHYFIRFTVRTPLLAVLLAAVPFLAGGVHQSLCDDPARARRCPPAWATAAGAYLILCAMIIPHRYSTGYAGSGRVVNMYHLYVLLALPLAEAMILMRVKHSVRAKIAAAKKPCFLLAIAAFALCLALGQAGNYVKLVSDQMDGTQKAYIAQFKNEYALCRAGGETDDVVIPAWQVTTVTGKPTAYEDPAFWTNEAMASYFGIRSVRVGE